MNEEFDEIKSLINSQIELKSKAEDLKEKLIDEVAKRVEFLMNENMELFFNHLYRMDVDEKKVMQVLNPVHDTGNDESVYRILAKLIIARQEKRLETKKLFQQKDWLEI